MKDCMKSLNIDEKTLGHKAILAEIGRAKDSLLTPEEFARQAGSDFRLKKVADCYSLYQRRLKEADAMDFDDLLCKTVDLFLQCPDVRERYQRRYKYIMVDEYQDTNHAQYKLISLLAEESGNLCVVGDDDQSIYKFRGATIENILSFEDEFKGCTVIRLEQNYRSTKTILNAANAVIAKTSTARAKPCGRIILRETPSRCMNWRTKTRRAVSLRIPCWTGWETDGNTAILRFSIARMPSLTPLSGRW